jgi:alpha-L-fucosidase 2
MKNIEQHKTTTNPPNRKRLTFKPVCLSVLGCMLGLIHVGSAKEYILNDNQPAEITLKGWENDSYPLGNGYFGVNFFGGIDRELWQFTEPTVYSYEHKPKRGSHRLGLSACMEVSIETDHDPKAASNYTRELDIIKGVGLTSYVQDGVTYTREQLTSYPDKSFVAKLTSSERGKISFRLAPKPSYPDQYHTAEAVLEGDEMVLNGVIDPLKIRYQARIAVEVVGGTIERSVENGEGLMTVVGADSATVYVTLGTNYKLEPEVFSKEPGVWVTDKKLNTVPESFVKKSAKLAGNPVPVAMIKQDMDNARASGWGPLKERQLGV